MKLESRSPPKKTQAQFFFIFALSHSWQKKNAFGGWIIFLLFFLQKILKIFNFAKSRATKKLSYYAIGGRNFFRFVLYNFCCSVIYAILWSIFCLLFTVYYWELTSSRLSKTKISEETIKPTVIIMETTNSKGTIIFRR